MDNSILDNYSELVKLDLMINNLRSKYPFTLNERARYTQHEIQLYQRNYCGNTDQHDNKFKRGGADKIGIAIVDI